MSRTPLLSHHSFYLVGIKGVAMTSLAQCLTDAGKQVSGCDTAEDFVTKPLLDALSLHVEQGFSEPIPADVDCVVYTAAHQGLANPSVQAAAERGIDTISYAQAIAELCNQKQGIAVSGVGGKSTVTAMIVWLLEKLAQQPSSRPSYAVGVGDIPGLNRTGAWRESGEHFVIEADEYVADPTAPLRGEETVPKMLLLNPSYIICTNLKFDHPDVYRDFAHTKAVFTQFFHKLQPNGVLITNADDHELQALVQAFLTDRTDVRHLAFGVTPTADWHYSEYHSLEGTSSALISGMQQQLELELHIPGEFNMRNALAALAEVTQLGHSLEEAVAALGQFKSTKRRFELIGEKQGVTYYDDYAHHPHEVAATIQALKEWYPSKRTFIIFQPHTFSRTKTLFTEFVHAFSQADQLIFTDIFASAREPFDSSITSDILVDAIQSAYPNNQVQNLHTNAQVASYLQQAARPGDVVLTMGAGDVYHIHELLP